MAASLDELAYEISRGSIQQQESRLGELRSRTGTLLAAAAVAASFFGARVAGGVDVDVLAVLALVAYVLSSGACLYVLLPHELVLEFRGSALKEAADEVGTADVADGFAAATVWIEHFHEENRKALDDLSRWYTVAVVFLGIEIVLWTASVGGTVG